MSNYKEDLKNIKTLIFDYDGVLTDGVVLITNTGDQLRTGHVKDGYALQLAVKSGLRIVVISGGFSESVKHRCAALNLTDVFLGIENKLVAFNEYIEKHQIDPKEVLYMGDDIPDFEVMKRVGVAVCPADAAQEIKSISRYISHFEGGKGCVRDIIEQVLKIQGKWMNGNAYHW